jgi:hypothetical protein
MIKQKIHHSFLAMRPFVSNCYYETFSFMHMYPFTNVVGFEIITELDETKGKFCNGQMADNLYFELSRKG